MVFFLGAKMSNRPIPDGPLSDLEKKTIAELLTMATDEFRNHGCNDFDLENIG